MRLRLAAPIVLVCVLSTPLWSQQQGAFLAISADALEDKIRGGMLGQILGNLNGLPHEFKYIDEPGRVQHYTPSLPHGAFTDDDTDIEWVYLRAIAERKSPMLPPDEIAARWRRHINDRIWASNRYARDLMELGIDPPWTGNVALNPFAEFNISGQFVCESFGLMAPAMPQTAAKIGLNFTHVTIDGEPAQTTQLFTAMIATAFVEDDVDKLFDAGLAAVDPRSRVAQVLIQTRELCRENPHDWRATRAELKRRWQTHGGQARDRNGYELNTASTIAALIYGQRAIPLSIRDVPGEGLGKSARNQFTETLRLAFNFGWDCDNNAATAATIIGVIKGRRWMNQQGWPIKDLYRNTSRDGLPKDETLTGLENTLIACARIVIEQNGGQNPLPDRQEAGEGSSINDSLLYHIPTEPPANIEKLASTNEQLARARESLAPQLARDFTGSPTDRARAAYLAICLGEEDRWRGEHPAQWASAVAELQTHKTLMKQIFTGAAPAAKRLRAKATRAGLTSPPAP
jgi:hypothetical protein